MSSKRVIEIWIRSRWPPELISNDTRTKWYAAVVDKIVSSGVHEIILFGTDADSGAYVSLIFKSFRSDLITFIRSCKLS